MRPSAPKTRTWVPSYCSRSVRRSRRGPKGVGVSTRAAAPGRPPREMGVLHTVGFVLTRGMCVNGCRGLFVSETREIRDLGAFRGVWGAVGSGALGRCGADSADVQVRVLDVLHTDAIVCPLGAQRDQARPKPELGSQVIADAACGGPGGAPKGWVLAHGPRPPGAHRGKWACCTPLASF